MSENSNDRGLSPADTSGSPGVGPNSPAEPGPMDVPPEFEQEEYVDEHESTLRRLVNGILADKMALFGAIVVLVFLFTAVFAPFVAPHDPEAAKFGIMKPPFSQSTTTLNGHQVTVTNWLGTDSYGHDLLSRMVYGARVSLLVALSTVAVAFVFGTSIGLAAGYYGGWVDSLLMRYVDFQWAFPELILGVGIIALTGSLGVINVVIAIGIAYIDDFARLIRGEVLSIREEEYITAARAVGMSNRRIMTREILPNAVAPLIVQATLMIPLAIIAEAGLSFLGLGVKPTTPTWGLLLSEGRGFLQQAWWISVMPGIAIMITVLAFNMLGDGLRDVFDVNEGEVEDR